MIERKLEGQVALVTGAGRGIGAAVARKLAAEGARVVACDLDQEPLERVVSEIETAGNVAIGIAGDVTDLGFDEELVGKSIEHFGGLDIVINNAGYIWNTTIQKTTDEQWLAMLDVHATAPFRILRTAFPHLRAAARRDAAAGSPRHRKVVTISSISGIYGAATQIAYASAKAAVVGMTKTLAKEWGRYFINVNCVAFGLIDTRLTQETPPQGKTIEVKGRHHKVGFPKEILDKIPESIALGRPGTPEEAAGAVYLLCLPESDFITGHILECSGGAIA